MSIEAPALIDPYRRGRHPERAESTLEFGFADALDIVNPLQHLPGIGWLYREISGDTIGAPAAIAGGALFGGPVGFVGAILAAAFESLSGETPENMLARAISPTESARASTAYSRAAGLAGG